MYSSRLVFHKLIASTKFQPQSVPHKVHKKHEREDFDLDNKEMVYPFFKLTAKLVHEFDAIKCERPGTYYVVFGNKHSWLTSRSVDLLIQLSSEDGQTKRCHYDGTMEVEPENLCIVKHLQLEPHQVARENFHS